MKIDPYKHKEKYLNWKEKINDRIPDINEENSNILLQYLGDMENGLNVAQGSKKGARSYINLNAVRYRLLFLCNKFESRYPKIRLTELAEGQLHSFFTEMRNGTITKQDGEIYKSVADYVKAFKAFWHWHQKVNRKKGIRIEDTTTDLDTSKEKPQWVYLDNDQIKQLCDNAKYEYKVLMTFLFDTGIRAPTELINIKVSDLIQDCKELHIREEISKTFGRRT